MPKSLFKRFQNYAEHLERDQRGEGGEKARDIGNVTLSERLEGFSLCVENENMLRKATGIFFVQEKKEAARKKVIKYFICPVVEIWENSTKTEAKRY